jgi:Ras-related protein Rab-30
VPTHIGQAFADGNSFEHFVETSALNATNVDQLFVEVASKLTAELKANERRCV